MSARESTLLKEIVMAFLLCALAGVGSAGQSNAPAPATASNVVACRVLEAHIGAEPAVTVVVFHQRDRGDQARLASLLKQNSGERAEIQASDGKWQSVTVVRLRSCFGRGLLLVPAGGTAFKVDDTFLIKFPAGSSGAAH